MDEFPKIERGTLHLTPTGWVRQDQEPFPGDRLESWTFEREQPAEDAKERVCLSRVWVDPRAGTERAALSVRFGAPFQATPERNVLLECDV